MTTGAAMFLLDVVLVILFWPFAVWLAGSRVELGGDAVAVLLYPLADMLFLYALGLYRRDAILEAQKSIARIPLVVGASVVTAGAATMLLHLWLPGIAGADPARLFVAAVFCFTTSGLMARLLFRVFRFRARLGPRLLVIGAGHRAWDLAWVLRNEGRNLHYDVTFVHDDTYGPADQRLIDDPTQRIVSAEPSLLEVARRARADEIVVAPDERRGVGLQGLIACKTAGYPVQQYMSFLETEIRRIDIKRLDLSWVLYSEGFHFSPLDRLLKRMLDVAVSMVILLFALPFLIGGMIAVWVNDRGPIFYRQERVTRGGKSFMILKLRTMRVDAEAQGVVWAAASDSRITRVGNFMRRTRFDEIPQLFNVLKGDMSLVGPRPERPQFTRELAEQLPLYNERHMVKAGLTGWAQINYPYGASLDDARSKLSYDLYYVKNFGILFDLRIILQTLRVVLWPSGVR